MNVAKVISELKASRKLLPLSIYHQCAEPSIELNKSDFDLLIPFMKVLFKAFNREGFTLHISKWGEIYLHSRKLSTAILLKITKQVYFSSNFQLVKHNTAGYSLYDMQQPKDEFIIKYRFADTKTEWRSISIEQCVSVQTDIAVSVIAPLLNISQQFQKRVMSIPSAIAEPLVTIDDIFAISMYCFANDINCHALIGIHKALCKHYISDYHLTGTGIIFAASWPLGETAFEWHSNDVKFLKNYLPCILLKQS